MTVVRQIGFPIRLGEWTLAVPTRRLAVWKLGVLDEPGDRVPVDIADMPQDADGYMLVQPDGYSVGENPTAKVAPGRMLYWTIRRGPRYFVRLDGTFEEYLGRFSTKTRSSLRRKWRRLVREAEDTVRFVRYGAGGFEEFYQSAREVSRYTYQEIMFDAGLPDDAESARSMREQMDAGGAAGFVLFVGSAPIAYLYCPAERGVFEYQYVGFRPDYARWSPGTVLLLMALEQLFEDSEAIAFDFTEGGGESSHKAFYATDSVGFETMAVLPGTLRNRCLILARAGVDRMSLAAGKFLSALGVKEHARKLLRRWRGVPQGD